MKGFFKPRNPTKYKGNPTRIVYRSGWELKMMINFDNNPDIEYWQSEEKSIPYIDPTVNRPRRYFPDFIIRFFNKETWMIEVKPKVQTRRPTTKNKKKLFKESLVFVRNVAKWEAAKKYCDQNGWIFKIYTEDEIFGNQKI